MHFGPLICLLFGSVWQRVSGIPVVLSSAPLHLCCRICALQLPQGPNSTSYPQAAASHPGGPVLNLIPLSPSPAPLLPSQWEEPCFSALCALLSLSPHPVSHKHLLSFPPQCPSVHPHCHCLYRLVRAAIMKYHLVSCLNNRKLLSHRSGGHKSQNPDVGRVGSFCGL